MAIYEQGYRPYLGPRRSLHSRPTVIAAHAIRGVWSRRMVKIILVGGLFIIIGSSIFLYLGWQTVGLALNTAKQKSSPFSPADPMPGYYPPPAIELNLPPPVPEEPDRYPDAGREEIANDPYTPPPLPGEPAPNPIEPTTGPASSQAQPDALSGEQTLPPSDDLPVDVYIAPYEPMPSPYWEQDDVSLAQGGLFSIVAKKPSLGFAILYQWTMIFEGMGVFLLAMAVLCGLVANDRKSGAIPMYLTRSVTRGQYLWGKLLAAFCLCGVLLVVPMGVLGLLDFGFSLPGHGLSVLWRVGGALLSSVLWSALVGSTVIAVSTLTPRPRLAAVFCAIAAFGPLIFALILREILFGFSSRDGWWIFDLLSPVFLALQTANLFLRSPVMFDGSPAQLHWYEPVLLIFWILLLISFAAWRIRRLGETRE